MHIYAGIGARATPHSTLRLMTSIARWLAALGWVLRSGGAMGADRAFEAGAEGKEIFLPTEPIPEAAFTLTSRFHPNWTACSAFARAAHARNAQIILGRDLNAPVSMVICWTPNAEVVGGTGQALRIAAAYEIPIINLANDDARSRILKWVNP